MMRATRTTDAALIVAAQGGDRRALDTLVTTHLPLVYTIVRRALGRHPDVDDVVQEIMLRAVQQLRDLTDPGNFRPWLAAIAVRRIRWQLQREHMTAGRTSILDDAAEVCDVDADVEGLTILQVELSAQRQQVVRASEWIDPEARALLSLWWLEAAGQLTRRELATTLGVSIAHAGVRLQRMRNQLELSRGIVAALDARPPCAELSDFAGSWDGQPSPLWRKRLARHTRSCAACASAANGMVATERLLAGYALLPVPVLLTASLLGKNGFLGAALGATSAAVSASDGAGASGGAGIKAGLLSQIYQAIGAHPAAAAGAAGILVVGGAVSVTAWPSPGPSAALVTAATPAAATPLVPTPRAPTAAPSVTTPAPVATRTPRPRASAGATAAPGSAQPMPSNGAAPPLAGLVSLESANAAGKFVAAAGDLGVLEPVGPNAPAGSEVAFEAVPGLADPICYSLRAPDGRYLRHASWRVRLSQDEGTDLFRADATFCLRTGSVPGSVLFESANYPGRFLHHRNDELWVDQSDGSAAFRADCSFVIRSPMVE